MTEGIFVVMGVVLGIVLHIIFLHARKPHQNGILNIHLKQDGEPAYQLLLFDPIDEWGKKRYLTIKVIHENNSAGSSQSDGS